MNFKIGQVEFRIFEMDMAQGHIRACVNFPLAGHEVTLAGEYDNLSGKPFYMSVEIDKKGDEPHAEESAK